MSKQLLVFQHMSWEEPGRHLVHAAEEQDVSLHVLEVWHESIPDVRDYDGLIVLGGSPNVDQENAFPFLKNEKEALRQVLNQGKAYLGFCLGHQLLAEALGAKVAANFCRSIGFVEGHATKEGTKHPLLHGLPKSFPLFKWHSQAVFPPLPKGVDVLITSAACQVEAISVEGKSHIVGLQFDNQSATVADIRAWLKADEAWLSQPPGVDTSAILKNATQQEALMGKQFHTLFRNFVQLIP
jgi:GMP synthase-like glutamine amidotransferase